MDMHAPLPARFNTDRTAATAVEFALIAPVFIVLLLGLACFSVAFSISSGLQQLASEAARASVAGLSDAERTTIAQVFVTQNAPFYPFVTPQNLTLTTSSLTGPTASFEVSLTYDLSGQVLSTFGTVFPFLPARLHGSAVAAVSTGL